MKLKYYLRGLGIGIVVTAIIISFTKKTEELTDAEIKMRAAQLGMVEESVLADIQKDNDLVKETMDKVDFTESMPESESAVDVENTDDVQNVDEETVNIEDTVTEPEQDTENNGEEITNTEEAENTEEEITNTEEAENTEESMTSPEENAENTEETTNPEVENEQVESYIVISIRSGNGSEVVSQRLFEAGLINSASEYNKYLVKNGYDRKLRVGEHEIPVGATEEEMAKILCGMR